MTAVGETRLPDLLLAAFRKAMEHGDDKAAEHIFRALECHAEQREWQQALREAERSIIGRSSSIRPGTH